MAYVFVCVSQEKSKTKLFAKMFVPLQSLFGFDPRVKALSEFRSHGFKQEKEVLKKQ